MQSVQEFQDDSKWTASAVLVSMSRSWQKNCQNPLNFNGMVPASQSVAVHGFDVTNFTSTASAHLLAYIERVLLLMERVWRERRSSIDIALQQQYRRWHRTLGQLYEALQIRQSGRAS